MSAVKQALESCLTECGWTSNKGVWSLGEFRVPHKTIEKFSQRALPEASQQLAKSLEFGAKKSIEISRTIKLLNGRILQGAALNVQLQSK